MSEEKNEEEFTKIEEPVEEECCGKCEEVEESEEISIPALKNDRDKYLFLLFGFCVAVIIITLSYVLN